MSTINANIAGVWTEIPDDVKVATTAPTDGSTLWVDTSGGTPVLNYWDGAAYQPIP